MKITELIKARKSVRDFSEDAVSDKLITQIVDYSKTLRARFGGHMRLDIIKQNFGSEPVEMGTYGMIKNGKVFLVLIHDNTSMASLSAAYFFEQIVLYCTELGLGTCWMAAFNKGDFEKLVRLDTNETLSNVSPVGYAVNETRFMISLSRKLVKADVRKPFESLFFETDFQHPLTSAAAGNYQVPLEMLRLAPSASNKQPWRVILDGDKLHFYKIGDSQKYDIDLGIALCHFEQTCLELNLKGDFIQLDNTPKDSANKYIISWQTK